MAAACHLNPQGVKFPTLSVTLSLDVLLDLLLGAQTHTHAHSEQC